MANNQPLNTEISVKNRIRSQRPTPNSMMTVKDAANRMHPLVMAVVSREVVIGHTRDNPVEKGVTTTALLFGRDSGLPLVTFVQPTLSFASAANDMFVEGEVDFPVQIGQDKFLQPLDGLEGEDVQADLRDVPGCPTYAP